MINKQGGLLGRQIALQVRDDEFKPDVGVRKFEELLQAYKIVATFGAVSGGVDVAVTERAAENHIPHSGVSQMKTHQTPGKQPYHWGFQTDALMGLAGAEYAVKNLGPRHYILYADYAWGWDNLAAWEKGVKKNGGQIIGKDAVPLGAADYSPFLTKALAAKPDVLVLINFGMDTVNSVKQVDELGLKDSMKVFVPLMVGGATEKAIGPKAMEGIYCGVGFYWEVEKIHPSAKPFVAAFEAEFKAKPSGYAFNCYQGVMAWADAVKIAKTFDGQAIIKVWGSPKFSFDHGKGQVRWRAPDRSAIEEWYICKGRSPADIAKEPDRILDIVKVSGGSEEYLYSPAELGYK
jgi:branched-chain amino acid transport system substrate-binding protein